MFFERTRLEKARLKKAKAVKEKESQDEQEEHSENEDDEGAAEPELVTPKSDRRVAFSAPPSVYRKDVPLKCQRCAMNMLFNAQAPCRGSMAEKSSKCERCKQNNDKCDAVSTFS